MPRRSDAEIVADLKKQVREKQERAARKSDLRIPELDSMVEALLTWDKSPIFSPDQQLKLQEARRVLAYQRDLVLDEWVKKNG